MYYDQFLLFLKAHHNINLFSDSHNSFTMLTAEKEKKVKADISQRTIYLRDVTCHMGSHSVTCHPTQVNAPHLTPAMQAGS